MRELYKDTAANVMVFMADSSDHVTGKAAATLTITASKDGAAFSSISPTVTERGNGWYSLALTAAHTDTLGDLALHITATGADPADVKLLVVSGVAAAQALLGMADGVEVGVTVQQALRAILATSAGEATGLDLNAPAFLAPDGITTRVSGDTDANGNRSNVVLNLG